MANQFKPFPLTNDQLHALCVEKGMSQADIAKAYGIGQSSVSRHLVAIGLGGIRNRKDYNGENNPNWKGSRQSPCANCGNPIGDGAYSHKKNSKHTYCSRRCYGEHKTKLNQATIACANCGASFVVQENDAKSRRYCSRRCSTSSTERNERIGKAHRGKSLSEQHKQAVSKFQSQRSAESTYTRGKSGYHDSNKAGNVFYRSSYERAAYEILDNDPGVVSYKPEPFAIEYLDLGGSTRRYRPDILVQCTDGKQMLIEIKPAWQIDSVEFLCKATYAFLWARSNNMVYEVWTEGKLGLLNHNGRYQGQRGPTMRREGN